MPGSYLSALEAGFLYAESPTTPMHMGSVAVFDAAGWFTDDGQLKLADLRSHIYARVGPIRRLRQYPVRPLGRLSRPRWVDDDKFDINRHVRSIDVASQGAPAELTKVVETVASTPIDLRHPLWELWFVTGLEHGQVGLIEKIHHALVDGVGGVDVAVLLLDGAPVTSASESETVLPAPVPNRPVELLARSVWDVSARPMALAGRIARQATHPSATATRIRDLWPALADFGRGLSGGTTPLNEMVGPGRQYRTVVRSLDETREAAHVLGGTVNDLVLAAVSGGLRDLLVARGDPSGGSLRALVPVSIRADDEHGDLGNRVAAILIPLATELADPADRFAQVRQAVREARSRHQVELSTGILDLLEFLPEPLIAVASGLVHHQPLAGVVVTNVPGPAQPLFLMGSRMLSAAPIVPLAGNLTVSIGILSYAGALTLGFWADRDRFPDLDLMVAAIDESFDALVKLASGNGR